ncbi:nitrate- and nitrite sensing domain-containing protein [Streptomyces sp. NPDC057638]|uniref:nitrate- and nitrite sensing domain-containing protein n=1 Tax=Streptomyces sp. NPDC057638 TaxID=3346190 RepID=UPI0036BA1B18
MTSSAEQQTRGNFTPPSRAAASPAEEPGQATPAPPPPSRSGPSKLSPRNWRVSTRLNAILLIPVGVGLVMGGFQVSGSIDTWDEARDAEKTARIVAAASEYSTALLNERDITAAPLLRATTPQARQASDVGAAHAATDEAKRKFDQSVKDLPAGQGLERRLRLFRGEEPGLRELRETAYTTSKDPVATEEGYVKVQHSLMEFSNELGLGTGNVTSYGRMVYAIQLAKAAESLQRSIGMHLLVRPSEKADVFNKQTIAFNSYNYLEQIAIAEFVSGGTDTDNDKLLSVMANRATAGEKRLQEKGLTPPKGPDESVFSGMAQLIGTGATPAALAKQDITPESWMATATSKFEGYTEVERDLVDRAVREASAIAGDARRDAFVNGGITIIALLTAFILAGAVARQMSRSMNQLRGAAFAVAGQKLPLLVDQLSRAEPGRVDTRVEPIPIDTKDEIGEVARAFDQIHREAVRLAAEQAMLRGNVNAIFTNLSRRNQSLIEGQLTLITELENSEADPDQLESLFRLDHLATRMRRNGENLLILAGEEPGRDWNQPVPLVDVLRAASSEVESYERIELTGVPETDIHGRAVTDLVHLLAELLENATTFSSPQTKVRVTATRLPDGRLMIEIHDKGIGLTAEDFADINHKLAHPPTVDVAVSQRMGLFVVGRLADRHGIRVQLRPSGEQAGTTSLVMLPDAITRGGGGEPAPVQGDFTVSQIIPEQAPTPSYASAPQRTAAELGFDDGQFESQQAEQQAKRQTKQRRKGALNPVGRSLQRGERRAALEAQTQQVRAPEAGVDAYGQSQDAYGQNPAGYGQNPQTYGQTPAAYGQDPAAYGENPAAYSQSPAVHGQDGTDAPAPAGYPVPERAAEQTQPYPALDPAALEARTYPAPDGQAPGLPGVTTPGQGYPPAQDAAYPQTQHSGYSTAFGPGFADQSYAQGAGAGTGTGAEATAGPAAGAPTGPYPGQSAGPGHAPSGDRSYPEAGYPGQAALEPPSDGPFTPQPHQGDWTDQNSYPQPFAPTFQPEAEPASSPSGAEIPTSAPERVGFDRPGPSPSGGHQLTEAGLPRRGSGTQQPQSGQPPQRQWSQPGERAPQLSGSDPSTAFGGGEPSTGAEVGRSANDERWQRAEKLREPRAGGVTSSGLPVRVPKANLIEGAAEQTTQHGPQVSRAPEDVRGRLSNLRRGVQQGRSAGTDTNGPGSGPAGTYNQER